MRKQRRRSGYHCAVKARNSLLGGYGFLSLFDDGENCQHCGEFLVVRNDDKPEVVLHRLETYHAQTEPLKVFYEKTGKLLCVEGQEEVKDTTALVLEALASL